MPPCCRVNNELFERCPSCNFDTSFYGHGFDKYFRTESRHIGQPTIDHAEPTLVNPASKENVITVLQIIEQQCFASSERKWVAVMCDGVPYTFDAVMCDGVPYTFAAVMCDGVPYTFAAVMCDGVPYTFGAVMCDGVPYTFGAVMCDGVPYTFGAVMCDGVPYTFGAVMCDGVPYTFGAVMCDGVPYTFGAVMCDGVPYTFADVMCDGVPYTFGAVMCDGVPYTFGPVMCDGVPYTFGAVIQDEFKECSICLCFVQNGDLEEHSKMHEGDEFSFQIPFNRIHLRPGPGHIEMNIARLILSLLWVPFIKDLANDLGFRIPNAQQVFKNGIDHHRSRQVLEICLYSLAKELVLPYIRTFSA